jgi:predicted amidohydrolase
MPVKIGLVQMVCEKAAIEQNLQIIQDHVNQALAQNVEILLFPEMSITGYINPEKDLDAILTLSSPAVKRFVEMSRGHAMTLLAGIVERNPRPGKKPYITQLVARQGYLLGCYRKLTIEGDEAPFFDPGPAEITAFPGDEAPFGVTICADINNPGLFREYARLGAKFILEAAAPGLYGSQAERNRESGYNWWKDECETKLGRYARENNVYIAVATQAGRTRDEDFPGGGYLLGPDGTLLTATEDWSPGMLVVEVPDFRAG